MAKSKTKTEKIPPYNTFARTVLVKHVVEFQDYKEKIKEGYPLRTAEELDEIITRYEDGLTFEDINNEQSIKSPTIKLKKPTFRKYIQDNLLPKSKGYKVVGQKRMAVFPNNIISHINFLYYFYQVADKKTVDLLLVVLKADQIGTMTFLEAIESVSDYDNLYAGIYHYICFDDGDIASAIEHVLANKPLDQKKVLKILNEIDKKFEVVTKEISKLERYLKQHTIKPSEIPESSSTT